MRDDEYHEVLLFHLRRLTPAGQSLLRLFAEHPGEWLTRRQLASLKNRSYLIRHDIKLLNQLVAAGFVEHRRERMADAYGEAPPHLARGNQIALWSFYHSYRLVPGLEHYLLKPRPSPPPRQAVKPLATYQPSLLDRLLEKIGF